MCVLCSFCNSQKAHLSKVVTQKAFKLANVPAQPSSTLLFSSPDLYKSRLFSCLFWHCVDRFNMRLLSGLYSAIYVK